MSENTTELWEEIKASLHIAHSKLDNEIKSKISACKLDMKRVGIEPEIDDGVICLLCELFVKWHLNYNSMGSEFQKSYEEMRDAVSLSENYKLKERSCTGATGDESDESTK